MTVGSCGLGIVSEAAKTIWAHLYFILLLEYNCFVMLCYFSAVQQGELAIKKKKKENNIQGRGIEDTLTLDSDLEKNIKMRKI